MTIDYQPLLSDTSLNSFDLEEKQEYPNEQNDTPPKCILTVERALFMLSAFLNIFLLISVARSYMLYDPRLVDPVWGVEEPLYSPAQSAIKYERRVFGFLGAKTIYHGPPIDETDKAWNDLYPVGMTRITKAEADLLPNRTEPIPDDEGHYLVALDVFHQLHCLNAIRRALSPDRYGPPVKGNLAHDDGFDHVDHCVNSIRESLMCSADITPNVWQWDYEQQISFPRLNNVHTCRSWESITAWAAERKLLKKFDHSIHVLEHHH